MFHRHPIHLFVLVYVDDIIVTGTHSSAISTLFNKLQQDFAMKDLGPLSYFLGIQAVRDSTGLHLHQSKYIIDLLHRSKMIGVKPYASPCISGSQLSKFDGDPLPDPTPYHHIVGALQYCTLTRLDIALLVNQLCQFLHAPTTTHMTAAKKVLQYLKGTLDHGLYYTRGSLQLNAFCDADWAGVPKDRHSTTSIGVFLGPCFHVRALKLSIVPWP
jgi:hypothetical protein